MKRATSFVIGLTAAACTLTACGSSSTTASTATKASGTGTVALGGTPASGTTASGGTAAATATTKAAASGGGGNTGKFCELSKAFKAKYGDSGAFGNLSTDKPADIKAFFQAFDTDVKAWEAAAPAEIKPAIVADVQALTAIEAALSKYDYDFTKAVADPTFASVAEALGTDTVAGQASADEQVTAFMKDKCGITDTTG